VEETKAEVELDPEEEEQEEESEEEEINEKGTLAKQAKSAAAAGKKELKTMPVGDLQSLMESMGRESGKMEDMISAVLTHEARVRAAERKRLAETKAAVCK